MKTAVIYARYSSSNQTEQSIDGQKHVCEDYAKKHDILIVNYYIDRAISGTTDNREAFQQMLKDSNNKKWNYVLVYKLDRFARNKYESAIHRKHLKDNGINLLSAMENIPETPEGSLMESLLEGMNEYFSKELAQKVARGLHESRMKGHCIGAVGFGYTKENKMLKINEDEAIILKRIFQEYESGKTILQIAREFEEENITNKGKKFIPEVLRYILKREIYTGICRINNKEYNKIYPQIISKELFEKVNKALNANRYGCRKDNHEIFRLKDKIYCGCCNRKMYPVSAISQNGNSIRYYKCITTKKNNCTTGNIDKAFIENIANEFILAEFDNAKNLERIINKVYEVYLKRVSCKKLLNSLKNELQRINTSISNIMIAIEKGILTDTTKSRLEQLETQKKELQEKVLIEESKMTYEMSKEDILEYYNHIIKQCPEKAFEVLIKQVKVYENKIEVSINGLVTQPEEEQTNTKLYTERLTTKRQFKGGTTKTQTKYYDIYLVI